MSDKAADPALLASIRTRLEAELAPRELIIEDDSARHAGHREAGGRYHLKVRIVSTHFAGLSRLDRHRLVQGALAQELAGPVHALNIAALAPNET
jgi:BolA protein